MKTKPIPPAVALYGAEALKLKADLLRWVANAIDPRDGTELRKFRGEKTISAPAMDLGATTPTGKTA